MLFDPPAKPLLLYVNMLVGNDSKRNCTLRWLTESGRSNRKRKSMSVEMEQILGNVLTYTTKYKEQ